MNWLQKLFMLFAFLNLFSLSPAQTDSFDEELMLKPLSNGYVYAYFQFTTLWEAQNNVNTLKHTHLFPRGLAEIIGRHHVDELHVSLTEGLWKYEKYGYPFYSAGPGAEISAWFNRQVTDVDREWKGLTNALSGLLCASLNFVDSSNSLSPEFSFRHTGATQVAHSHNSSHLRYSSLPRETACTENLTPFKKLLPCDSRKGLATLLNSAFIHNTNYHSIGIHFRSVCRNPECTYLSMELKQTVSLVYDTVEYPQENWSTRKLFGIGLRGACPLATLSNIYVDISSNGSARHFELSPPPNMTTVSLRGGQEDKYAIYNVRTYSADGAFSIAAVHKPTKTSGVNYPTILYAHRYINGYGQEKGSLVTKLYNNHWQPLDVVFLENVPWYLPLYLHSMKITRHNVDIKPMAQRYIPGKERKQPYYLEIVLRLPPRSVTKFSVDVDYMFLKWQEYPPDANHGFYMGPAIVTAMLPVARNYTALPQDGSTITSIFNATRSGYLVQLRTEPLLISLPTPDFSMPYNVICLACTAVALAFGPLHNISTKKLVLKRIEKKGYLHTLLTRLKKLIGTKEKTA
ncbi:GPI transamidase component PIG-T [Copidosoma floridanum]|uniref:GPI transamidase component PIG-T n=1 Tax=Copidosoma floridanum TaxID=29053 RepID=UPI0006C97633|nr:GPI transamidase component PIG-T [Copidosoma floridanum]